MPSPPRPLRARPARAGARPELQFALQRGAGRGDGGSNGMDLLKGLEDNQSCRILFLGDFLGSRYVEVLSFFWTVDSVVPPLVICFGDSELGWCCSTS